MIGSLALELHRVARVQAAGVRLAWRATSVATGIAIKLGRNRRSSMAWHGLALHRAGRADASVAAYVSAISGDPNADLADVISRLETGEAVDSAAPEWYFGLGESLRKRGQNEQAAIAIRAATRRVGKARWLRSLAAVEVALGNLAASADSLQRLAELHGPLNSSEQVRLATQFYRAGMWAEAHRLLTVSLESQPEHVASLRRLALAASMIARWGGSFADTLDDRHAGRFVFDAELAATARAQAVDVMGRAVALRPHRTQWRAAYAEALWEAGRAAEAAEQYEVAMAELAASTESWTLDVKQKWQFPLERAHHLLGSPRVDDPLFDCAVQPADQSSDSSVTVAGLLNTRFGYAGLTVSGLLATSDAETVEILINGTPVRSVNVSKDGHFPRFTAMLKRDTVALLPKESTLRVRTTRGETLHGPGGATEWTLTIPHGDGRLMGILASGGKVDKKGELSSSAEETAKQQDHYLEIYSALKDFFDRKYGNPVFLLYGTLLGYHRDGDFIPGDDDFDAGYITDRTDPQSVKEETCDIIVDLVRDGFIVLFNRLGRLLRVQLELRPADSAHIDLRPLWFESGNLWMHNHVCMPLNRADFLPVVEGTLRGTPVYAPRDSEAFLRGHYGPGWKVPDPAFTYYPSEVRPSVRENLSRALITVGEYRELAARIERECAGVPGAGRLVSLGSQDLYPLDSYIR